MIYDKRGTGQSGGTYESYEPYENLVNDALSAITLLKGAPRDRSISDWNLGAQSRRRDALPLPLPDRKILSSSLSWGHPSPTA